MRVFERLKKNSSGFFVVLFLALIVLMGSRVEQPSTNNFLSSSDSESCTYNSPVEMYSADLGELTIESLTPLTPNQNYVLVLELRLDEPKAGTFTASSVRSDLGDYSLSVDLLSDDGASQRVDFLTQLKSGKGFQPYDLGFSTSIEVTRIRLGVVDKLGKDVSELFRLTARNFTITPVDGKILSSRSSGFLLDNDSSPQLVNNDLTLDAFASFSLGKPVLSTHLNLEPGHITGITAALETKGNGGVGEYKVFIAELDKAEGSSYKLGTVINELGFSAGDLSMYADERYSTQGGRSANLYTFPLTAVVKGGRDYVVGIDATQVGYNWEHSLLIGQRSVQSNKILVGKKWYLNKRQGELLLVASRPNQTTKDNMVTYGSRIIHISPTKAKFYYKNSHTPLDLLAVDPASSAGVRYDNSARIVLAPARDNHSIVYSINTIYPISYFSVEADQRCETTVPVKLEYSVDNQASWKPVDEGVDIFPYAPSFSSGRVTVDKLRKVDIRVSYRENRTSGSGQSDFGLTNLRVIAELITK